MKKATLLLFVALFAFSAYAQNDEKRWAFGIGAGIYDGQRNWLKEDQKEWIGIYFNPEAYISRFISPSFDTYLKGNFGFKPYRDDKMSSDFVNAALNFRYKLFNDIIFPSTSKVQPYLFAGPTYLWDNQGTDLGFHAGLGFKFPLTPSTSLYLEGAYLDGVQEAMDGLVTDNIFKATAGLEFAFGDNDWDNDGVKNKDDECPKNTPEEISKGVDAKGCPVDTDGDGVPDYRDDCPNTPKGCEVDLRGCPLDKDKDGVIDCMDDCPDVPGLKELKGCPDSDGDGIPDHKDECPDTPKGCKVDAKGCPIDTDGDGIIDCQDDCPNEPGPKENNGCPLPTCIDFEVNPVYFDFDKSTLRPEGMALLDEFVSKLGDCKNYEVVVNGHTCSIGSKNYNQGLSERRAQSVVKYLLSKGLNNAFVGSKGYGEEQPAVPNTTKANREKNRRAEVDLIVK